MPSYSTVQLFDYLFDTTNTAQVAVTVTCTPTQGVANATPLYILPIQQQVLTDSTGKFSFTLPQLFTGEAEYIVRMPGLPPKRVTIPAGAGPFQVSAQLATDSG